MHLVGVDIGFSERRRSNGIAVFREGRLVRSERLNVSERDAALRQLRDIDVVASLQRVWPGAPIVEAFPNTFLGVVVPDDDYITAMKIKRGGKFDWLYERWIHRGLFRIATAAAELPEEIAARCEVETDHDVRAALVCLLTAAFAAKGSAVVVGQQVDGYFYLPPAHLWAEWAKDAIDRHRV